MVKYCKNQHLYRKPQSQWYDLREFFSRSKKKKVYSARFETLHVIKENFVKYVPHSLHFEIGEMSHLNNPLT